MSGLVSVVVPVYNGMPHLRDLVDSLLAQDYPELEIVFAETGSTDGSAEFLATIDDPRVRVVPGAPGAAANWDAACRAANGRYIKLVCQDDLLSPDAVSKQAGDLDVYASAVMACAQRDIVDANGEVLYAARGTQGLKAGIVAGTDVIRACYLQGTNVIGEPLSVLFRRDDLLASLPWEDHNPLMLDVMMYAKVAPRGDMVVRKESVGAFRVSTSSWSTRLAKVQLQQFRQWQDEYVAAQDAAPSAAQRARAAAGVRLQAGLRRGAYAWLRMKGSFHSEA